MFNETYIFFHGPFSSHVGLPKCTMETAKAPLISCHFGSCFTKLFLTPPAMHWFGIATLEITLDTNEYTPHYNNQSGIATAQSNNIQHMSYIANKTSFDGTSHFLGGGERSMSTPQLEKHMCSVSIPLDSLPAGKLKLFSTGLANEHYNRS